jgi:penicillin-binding protein 1A
MKLALADRPAIPFKMPAGIRLIRVDPKTGLRVAAGTGGSSILEAFKPGTAPPDDYSVVGDADGSPLAVSPDADRAIVRSGTGGLY